MSFQPRNIAPLAVIMLAVTTSGFAAKPLELSVQSANALQSELVGQAQINLKPVNTSTDFQNVTHVRFQETYLGYPVWGADLILHTNQKNQTGLNELLATPNATVNGILYKELEKDLASDVIHTAKTEQAGQMAIQAYQKKNSNKDKISETNSNLIVYIDKNKKAHWAIHVTFLAESEKGIPQRPSYIMDAVTYTIYQEWDEIRHHSDSENHSKELEMSVLGGGFGGNAKIGKFSYDGRIGAKDSLPKLSITRNFLTKTCFMKNKNVIVRDENNPLKLIIQFKCDAPDVQHGNIFWNGEFDQANGGYSPSNDVMRAGQNVYDMYTKWYGVAPIMKDGKPLPLDLRVYYPADNAGWETTQNYGVFGNGDENVYPLTSLEVVAHEVSHGFTHQHSKLYPLDGQSGGLDESFSDIAGQAAMFFATGHNNWFVGYEIMKYQGESFRYFEDPTWDCPPGGTPGTNCSINHMQQFREDINAHHTCGIFNKAFYLIATSENWDTKKAFDVMVKANMSYWRSQTNFHNAASCVMKAAQDLEYDNDSIKKAFDAVGLYGVNANNCI